MQTISSSDRNQATVASFAFKGEDALSGQECALLLGALFTLATVIASMIVL